MFGYITVLKDELKIKDYNTYRAYYCGLCHEIGRRYKSSARLTLSYDVTALAVLLDSISDGETLYCQKGCVKHFGKRKTVSGGDFLEFAADVNIIMAYLKLKDNVSDDRSIKAAVAAFALRRRYRRAASAYPHMCKAIDMHMKRLAFLEETECDIVDKCADEFGSILAAVFAQKAECLRDFGYAAGRLVYAMDAYDDMDKDIADKSFNPAVLQLSYSGERREDITQRISSSLYFMLSRLAEEYEKLDIRKNKDILDNIVYMGVRQKADMIISGKKRHTDFE